MMLVYNLPATRAMYQRFAGVDGSAYLVGGVGMTALTALTAQNWGPTQQLALEAQRRGIPLQTLAAQFGMVLPAAQAFSTTSGSSSGSSSGTTTGTSSGSSTQQKTESTPFNPWSLAPLALSTPEQVSRWGERRDSHG